MDYQKIYNSIVSRAKFQKRIRRKRDHKLYTYYERHHIVPRCMNGSNEDSNLVLLTAREHYICHKLLHYIYPKDYKLFLGYEMMVYKLDSGNQKRKYIVSSREFDRVRIAASELRVDYFDRDDNRKKNGVRTINSFKRDGVRQKHIESQRRRWDKPEERLKTSASQKKRYKDNPQSHPRLGKTHTEEVRKRLSDYGKERIISEETREKLRARRHTIETKRKLSLANTGKFVSDETKRKISISKKNLPIVMCPHCNKSGNQLPMLRWHFDNCKLKKEEVSL